MELGYNNDISDEQSKLVGFSKEEKSERNNLIMMTSAMIG